MSKYTEVSQYLHTLNHELTEVRIFRENPYLNGKYVGNTISGYYTPDAYDTLVQDIQPYDSDSETTGIYTTLHSVNPELHARAYNRLKPNAKQTTSDQHISYFSVFPIDIDSANPAGVSATDAEKETSKQNAKTIGELLTSAGIPYLCADSGNGWHILVYLEPLQATDENKSRFESLVSLVGNHFGTDTTVYNPSRIWKCYGTMVRKGDSTEERPHRRAKIRAVDKVERISFDDLEKRLQEILLTPESEQEQQGKNESSKGNTSSQTLRDCLTENGINILREKSVPDGLVFYVTCPFNSDHTGTDAFCIQRNDGKWGFKCHHNSCNGKGWQDFKHAHGIATKHYVTDPPPLPSEIDTDIENMEIPKFPEALFRGIFEKVRDAYQTGIPINDAFIFAATKHVISAILGKSVWLKSGFGLYPNTYTMLIGDSADAMKGQTINVVKQLLNQADKLVQPLNSLNTPEGLLNMFVEPKEVDDEGETFFHGGYAGLISQDKIPEIIEEKTDRESIRLTGLFAEFSTVLQKSNKQTGAGLMEILLELYDCEEEIHSVTKTSPTTAHNPTWTMIGASDIQLIENSLDIVYVNTGLTNRCEWYLGEKLEEKYVFDPPINDIVHDVVNTLKSIRPNWRNTVFTWSEEALEVCKAWWADFHKENIESEKNSLIQNSMKRLKTHHMKNSLIFAVLRNQENKVEVDDVVLAGALVDYLSKCVVRIFADFVGTEEYRIENRVIEILKNTPRLSIAQIHNRMTWASRDQVLTACQKMCQGEILGCEQTQKTTKYFVLKTEDYVEN